MTVVLQKFKTNRKFTGYSYDTKPVLTSNDIGDEFYEEDTLDKYEWFGEAWAQVLDNGIAPIHNIEHHLASELQETLELMLDQLKILNTYMSIGTGESIRIDDIEGDE